MSRAKNPKYESMSLEELKANMEKSIKQLEHAIHNKNILEQRKRLVERKERSHRLIVKVQSLKKHFHYPEIWNRKMFRMLWISCRTVVTTRVLCGRFT